MDIAGEAPGAVAAHLGFAAVGVVIAHPEIGARLIGRLDGEQSVGSDPEMPVAKPGDLFAGEGMAQGAVVDDHEVIARPAHLDKRETVHTQGKIVRSGADAKPAVSRGGPGASRTPDQELRKLLLCPSELRDRWESRHDTTSARNGQAFWRAVQDAGCREGNCSRAALEPSWERSSFLSQAIASGRAWNTFVFQPRSSESVCHSLAIA